MSSRYDVTVILCTYNRCESLLVALHLLLKQETHGRFSYEVVIIDDGSTDGTSAALQSVAGADAGPAVRHVRIAHSGIPIARNAGISHSLGQWIAFIDDDERPDPDWLDNLLVVARHSGAECVGGSSVLELPSRTTTQLPSICRRMLGECTLDRTPAPYSSEMLPCTSNVLLSKSLAQLLGGFDSAFPRGSDADFFFRARRAGALIWAAPDAVVRVQVPPQRLEASYLKRRLASEGMIAARVRFLRHGLLRCFFGLLRRITRAVARDVWLLLWHRLRGDRTGALDRRCRLWESMGYVMETGNIGFQFWHVPRNIVPDVE